MVKTSWTTGACGGRFAYAAMGILALALAACGGGTLTPTASFTPFLNQHTQAMMSGAQIVSSTPGVSPFIQQLTLRLSNLPTLAAAGFTIAPKAGSASKPVDVSYTAAALKARQYMGGDALLKLPVFGLYAGYTNQVTVHLSFQDGSTLALASNITTADYADPTGIYQRPTILKQRAAGSSLGFDFFYIKSALGSPVVIDTDGEVRWAVPGVGDSLSTGLQDDEFVIGDPSAAIVHRLRLDGATTQDGLGAASITFFHHNIDPGKAGLLADVNAESNGVQIVESTVIEMTDTGSVFNQWELGAILSGYMQSQGDDPTTFVRPGTDWFHNNAATYDPSDDSVIISSRENFVIKLDYSTGRIIWILGDPTKYWYTFPSLRAKALTLAPGGLYPIGQHAISMTSDGHLLLFNDGLGSQNQPAGAPAGETRTFSAVSAYSIDTSTMTAQNVWNFEDGQTIYSYICSSAYTAPGKSLLIDYATADSGTQALLVGLDANHNVAFEFEYPTQQCNTSWNAVSIPLDSMTID
jgi:arylsulfate sulfotransferase